MVRVALPWLLVALVLAVVASIVYVVADGLVETLSLALFGIAAVIAVSAVFYAVGVSEDRARERGRH